jgi:hypothetical protein
MKTLSIPLLALVVLVSACNTKTLLVSKFDGDVLGTEPNKTLPGDPAGDEINYVNELAYRMRVRASPDRSGKALFYSGRRWNQPEISGHSNWISFKGASTTSKKNLNFSWHGRFSGFTNSTQHVLCDLTNGVGTVMVRLIFHQDGRVVSENDFSGKGPTLIGTINVSDWNFIVVNADRDARKFSILIGREKGDNIERKDLPFLNYGNPVDFGTSMRPSLAFQISESAGETSSYIVDDVIILQSN